MATTAKSRGENNDRHLMGPRDAARVLGLSYPTLKQWIYKGKIPTINTAGGHYRIAESALDKFLFRRIVAEGRMGYRSISARNQLVAACLMYSSTDFSRRLRFHLAVSRSR
jgi:excisionase family DNA binding protein